MHLDLVLACLLILLGAMLAYVVDEFFQLTPRMADWFDRMMD